MDNTKIYKMAFASVYPHYINKAEKKGRTKEEVHTIIQWLTGYDEKALQEQLDNKNDFETFFEEVIKHGDYVLSITPELLPVLKQAGVVDSGGQGLMEVVKGAYDAFLKFAQWKFQMAEKPE